MSPAFRQRLEFFKEAQNRRWVRAVYFLFAFIGVWDTVGAQLVPPSIEEKWPTIYELGMSMSGLLPWWGWVIGVLVFAQIVTIEYAVRRIVPLKSAVASSFIGAGVGKAAFELCINELGFGDTEEGYIGWMIATATNTGEYGSILRNWQVTIALPSGQNINCELIKVGDFSGQPPPGTPGKEIKFTETQALYNKAVKRPIAIHDQVVGVLVFRVPQKPAVQHGVKVDLQCQDVFGNVHKTQATTTGTSSPDIKYHPGIDEIG